MSISWTRTRAIFRKELLDYRRSGAIVSTMSILPVIFAITPLIEIFTTSASSLAHGDRLLYMLGIPALVPAAIAAYAVVGERQQGTLEPVLTTPVRPEELLLGKALAALVPSLVISYVVYGLVIGIVALFAQPDVASGVLRGSEIVAQLVFTPLVAGWSIWIGIAISSRTRDVRTAQQLGMLASLPTVGVAVLIAFGAIHASLGLSVGLGALLVAMDGLAWRIVAAAFNRERLITGTK